MRFDFAAPTRIIFGSGVSRQIPDIAKEFGRRAFVVTGANPQRLEALLREFEQTGVQTTICSAAGEPTVSGVRASTQIAKEHASDVVIGIGGGSAIDHAKAVAILATNSCDPLDYLEVIGKGKPFEHTPLPSIAVPTTAGTGAEVTRNAVLGSPEHNMKASLRSPMMLAKVALIDPGLTLAVPPEITAFTGLDTLTQLLEPFVSCRANPFVDVLCKEGMQRVRDSLLAAFTNGEDRSARESMSLASLLSGLALSNAGLGVVHGFASPLGGMLAAPHGSLCAAILPYGTVANIRALRSREPSHPSLTKYAETARILTGQPEAKSEDLGPWLLGFCKRLGTRTLGELGLRPEQIPLLVEKAASASSMKANPLPLTPDELTDIAERAL